MCSQYAHTLQLHVFNVETIACMKTPSRVNACVIRFDSEKMAGLDSRMVNLGTTMKLC